MEAGPGCARSQHQGQHLLVAGEKVEMEPEDIDRELSELARDYMSASKLKKLPGHIAKSADHALWKQYRH